MALVILIVAAVVPAAFGVSSQTHAATPAENWLRIENTWLAKRERDRQVVIDATTDLTAQLAGYKAFRDDTRGWMNDLAAVGDWEISDATPDPYSADSTTATELVRRLIKAGNDDADILDKVVASKTPEEVLVFG